MAKTKTSKVKEINKGIKKIKDTPIKKRNPFFNDKALSETNRTSSGTMKDRRTPRGGSKNKLDEYLEDLPTVEEAAEESQAVENLEDEEEHEYELL